MAMRPRARPATSNTSDRDLTKEETVMTATDTIDGPDTARGKSQGAAKTASLYRMAMPGHLCPFGLKSKSLLERKGFTVDDNLLTTGGWRGSKVASRAGGWWSRCWPRCSATTL